KDMDSDSRALIEQMLAEEEFYYGQNTMSTMKRQKKLELTKKKKSIGKKRKVDNTERSATISSSSLPSHKTRWTSEEDDQLKLALTKFGYGNWKPIANFVKTRNPLQCKNRSRHWVAYEKLVGPTVSPSSLLTGTETSTITTESSNDLNMEETKPRPSSPERIPIESQSSTSVETTIKNNNVSPMDENRPVDDEDEEISVEDDDDSTSLPVLTEIKEEILSSSSGESQHDTKEQELLNSTDAKDGSTFMDTDKNDNISTTTSIDNAKKIPEQSNNEIDYNKVEEKEHKTNGSAHPFSPSTTAYFDPYIISEEEKISNPEWFKNKHNKTPDRYLKIRNHLLACWQSCRPRYMTKTSSRKGLKDCGDVNAIGRVHSYLENIGAINVNCINAAPRHHRRTSVTDKNNNNNNDDDDNDPTIMYSAADLLIGYDGPRKRKVRNERGEWVDPKELEGRVIEHGQSKPMNSKPKRTVKRSQHYYGGDDFGRGYDPFRLVPVAYYDDQHVAPFTVEISSSSLLVMDFHSHLAHTEIIGLLGGTFVTDTDNRKQLKVESVFPCKSTSTGIQCEMDPESEMRAREVFAENGYTVVGWYHSHPTFEPHPSIRDIENQTSYQTLFRHEKTGDEPFIGVIVTPYDLTVASEHSQIQYLHISNQWDDNHSFRVPYACRRLVKQDDQVPTIVMDQMKELVDEFKDYEHKMNMLSLYGTQSRLDKLLGSLRSNLFMELNRAETFLQFVNSLMLEHFVDDEDKRMQQIGQEENKSTTEQTSKQIEQDENVTLSLPQQSKQELTDHLENQHMDEQSSATPLLSSSSPSSSSA
ncbi:uncharacterized protein BX664DRAFT_261895, partial [Halteromyces radiatus]|uniref:uncharacterized protein n=1 Tax=Halteromyces radiatus TaxID=101107 RepID=UPI00221EDD2B